MNFSRSIAISIQGLILIGVLSLIIWFSIEVVTLQEERPVQVMIRLKTDHEYRQFRSFLQSEIDRIESLDPHLEAKQALGREELRYFGVIGHGLVFPGIPESDWPDPDIAEGFDILDPTSEIIVDSLHRRFKSIAATYATEYNRTVWAGREADHPETRN